MVIRPINDQVLVERLEEAKTTESGIITEVGNVPKPSRGVVIEVGPGKANAQGILIAPEVSKGDHVIFGKYSGTDVKDGPKNYLIMREEEILGILEGVL